MYLLYSIGLFYITLTLYLAVMNLSRHKDTLDSQQKVIFFPIVLIGILCDVLFRWTVGIVLLADIDLKCHLFTCVLQKHVKSDSWRGKVARFICGKLLDKFDPSGRHC